MARINQLVNSATLNATDVLAKDAASGGTTNKITAQNLANGIKTLGSLVSTTEMNAAIEQSTANLPRFTEFVLNGNSSLQLSTSGSLRCFIVAMGYVNSRNAYIIYQSGGAVGYKALGEASNITITTNGAVITFANASAGYIVLETTIYSGEITTV